MNTSVLPLQDFVMIGLSILLALWCASYIMWRDLLRLVGEHRKNVVLAASLLYQASIPAILCQYLQNLQLSTVASVLGLVLVRLYKAKAIRKVRPPANSSLKLSPPVMLLGGLLLGLVAWALVGGYFWDENAAHFGVSSALARGVAPPQHPLFPGQIFRYHYGFNVLVAQIQAWGSIGVASAIDLVGVICFFALLASSAAVGGQLAGRLGANLAILLVPLGSGTLQYLLFSDFGMIEMHWAELPQEWFRDIPPPVISNFFQHPQGLAMACVLGITQLFDRSNDSRLRFALGSFFLGLCSLAHIVFFGLLGLGLGFSSLVNFGRKRDFNRLVYETIMLCLALGLAFFLGGFLSFEAGTDNFLTAEKDFFMESVTRRLLHHLVLFGLPLLLLPFALWRTYTLPTTLRVTSLSIAIIGFLIPNFISYERSWDIVKFFGIAAFFANVLLIDTLSTVGKRKWVLLPLVCLCCSTSVLWLARTSFLDGHLGIPKMHFPPPPPIAEAVAKTLSPRLKREDRIFSTNIDMSKAGLLTPGFNWRQFGQGYIMDRQELDQLYFHAKEVRKNLSVTDIKALQLRFLVLSRHDVSSLSPRGKRALNDPQRFKLFQTVTSGGQTRLVYEVLKMKDSSR